MARPSLVRLLASSSLLVLGSIAGCGGTPTLTPDGGTPDAGTDAAEPQPDAPRDVCDPYVLQPVADDPCELALPEGFLPARIFFAVDGTDVALDRLPDATYCEGTGGFTVDDETAPTIATLCPSTCSELPSDPTPEISGTACGI